MYDLSLNVSNINGPEYATFFNDFKARSKFFIYPGR